MRCRRTSRASRRIRSPARVLPTVAGTPQAQEAVIENSIPQTATVPLRNGPKFTPEFDGPPQYAPIAGTPLSYVTNSHSPVIQVAPNAFYAVTAGVWFTAPQLTGPWVVATSVPPVIYTIPPSLADLLRDLRARLRGDAAVRLRRLHAGLPRHGGRAVRHRRLRHRLRLHAVDRHLLVRASVHLRRRRNARLQPVRGIHLGLRDGPRHGGVDGALVGRRLLPSRLLGRVWLLRDSERQRLRPLGGGDVVRPALVVCGGRRRGDDLQRLLRERPHGHHRRHQCRPAVSTRGRAMRRADTTGR